ncbi:MAG TPA: phosphoribosyltransferase family protein [Bacteroidales bacterium]|nr:phosphoribosyltransferase family protein [Bacteroidales bacterium]
MNNTLRQYFQGFVGIFYPQTCAACGNVLYHNEEVICLNCFIDLPRTKFHHLADNEVARIFWGRIQIANATSFMYFTRDSRYRQILHDLKYNGQKRVGIEFGRLFGLELRNTAFKTADLILPVPLHPAKLRKRGYNQSELIAQGISVAINVPVETGFISRINPTATQTKRTRYERWENVRDSFRISRAEQLKNKHVILVDDVITTGATIEACASALTGSSENLTISIASLACVKLQ